MPGLVAFGRRWNIGGDDFVAPGCIDVVVKFCWLVAAITVYLRNDVNLSECGSGKHLRIYIYGIFANLTLIIFVDLLALKTSMTSYIMDTKSRRFLAPCIYLRVICEAVDVSWNLLGTIFVYGNTTLACKESPETVAFVKRFILCNWFSLVVFTLFVLCLWDRFGKNDWVTGHVDPFNLSNVENDYSTKHEAYWANKWKKLTCYCNYGRDDWEIANEGFQEIGKIFSTLLKDHDFVTTDVIAGFLSLCQQEKEKKAESNLADNFKNLTQSPENENRQRNIHHEIITRQPASLPCISNQVGHDIYNVPQDELEHDNTDARSMPYYDVTDDSIHNIVLVNHYLNFVLGSYGWQFFVSNNYRNRAVRRLWKQLQCCSCFRSQNFKVVGDNCCLCATGALQEAAQLSSKDLIYVSFQNGIYKPIFYVAIDHKTKSFVISIRGTMSIVDLVADFTAMPKTINYGISEKNFIPGLPSNFKAYHGVTLCASSVRKTLMEKKILEELKLKHPDYNLIFIGMSLGGGVATILGMMYLNQYPTLKVFAVSPPGGLLSLEASKFTESKINKAELDPPTRFTLSVVYGDDMIPRLSLPSVDGLKNKIIQAILNSRTPKYKILLGGCANLCCGRQDRSKITFAEPQNQSHKNKKHQANLSKHSTHQVSDDPNQGWRASDSSNILAYQMYLPGKILHITERPEYTDLQGGLRWQLRWADRREFREIIISPRMYKDHMHFRMEKALHEFVVHKKIKIIV